jgi:hypothetical protein
VTHFGCAIAEAEGLADVHVFLNGCVEKRSVDVKLAKLRAAAMARKRRRLAMRMTGENVSV